MGVRVPKTRPTARRVSVGCVVAASVAGLALLAGCGNPTSPPTTPASSISTSEPTASTPSAVPLPRLTRLELNPPVDAFEPEWEEVLSVGYGDAPELLGTSPGGDGEGIMWGPSYGTQLPDGTWWFVDTAKLRLAHYGETGAYLGDLPMPAEYLANGEYLQWARPLALSDGTLVLQSTTAHAPGWLLLAPDGTLSRTPSAQWWSVYTTDGTHLYGFDDTFVPIRIDPRTGASSPVPALATQGLPTLSVTPEPTRLLIDLGAGDIALPLTAFDGAQVHLGVEAVGGTDQVANLLLRGIVEDAPGDLTDVQGLLRIDASGRGTLDNLPLLTSEADPGDGLRLGVRWGDNRPWLMLITSDAVRVYRRSVA